MGGGSLDVRWHGAVGILVNAIFWYFRLVTWGLRALRQLALALMQMQYVDQFLISSCYLIFVSFRGFSISCTCRVQISSELYPVIIVEES